MLAGGKCSFVTRQNEAKCSVKHPAPILLHKRTIHSIMEKVGKTGSELDRKKI
jgi:hypothetical protein